MAGATATPTYTSSTYPTRFFLEPLFAFISGVGDDVIVLQKGVGPASPDTPDLDRSCPLDLFPTNGSEIRLHWTGQSIPGSAGAPLLAAFGCAKITCHVKVGCWWSKDLHFSSSPALPSQLPVSDFGLET